MEQFLIDYLTNAAWQIPLLAGGAWLFLRMGKFGPRMQHGIWLSVLALAIGLPLHQAGADVAAVTPTACVRCSVQTSMPADGKALPPAAIVTQFVVADPQLSEEFLAFRRPTLRLSPVTTDWLVGIYFAVLLLSLYKILASWRGARQLVIDADPTVLPPPSSAIFQDCGRRLRSPLPQLRRSPDVRSPVIVGVIQPVLLLPEDFGRSSQNEVQAALLHELAHVRRHDYLGNLLCQLAALPVAWHPLTHGVQQRIRRTREMICDDIAARAMQSEIGYAKCLLAIAGRTLRTHERADAAQAIGLFGDNVLEERMMRLMQEKTSMSRQARLVRIAGGAIAMMLAIAMAISFHVIPTYAQTSATGVNVTPPPAPPPPPAPEKAVPPAPPVAPDTVAPAAPAPPPVPPAASASGADAPAPPPSPEAAIGPVPPVTPIPPVAPRVPADAQPSPWLGTAVHPHPKKVKHHSMIIEKSDKSFLVDVNQAYRLSSKQQAQMQKDMAAMSARIAEATKRFNSPEFEKQMADIAKQQANIKKLDFAQMQRQIDAATAKINSPEFKQQMADIQKQIESGAMQRSMEQARWQMKLAEQQQSAMQKMDLARMQQQIAAATAKINSPEFKQRMADIQKQIESGAMQRSMEDAGKRLKAEEDRMHREELRQQQTK